MTYRLQTKKPHIISLMLLSAFASMGAILMTPALPEIGHYFNVSSGTAKFTVTGFLLGYALGQLFYGPIANRWGRKPAFYIGIVIATIGSVFSILSSSADSFGLLIVGRFLEALGSSAGLVVCFTMINDFYYKDQARVVTSLLMMAFAIVPGMATLIGGFVVQYADWQGCFYFLLIYGLLLTIPVWRLPETVSQIDHHALHYQHVSKNYWSVLRHKKLIGYGLLYGFTSACVYLFGAEGPFIGINVLHTSPALYGVLGLLPFVGTLLGSIVAVRLAKADPKLVLRLGFSCLLLGALVMLICFVFKAVSMITLLLPAGIMFLGVPMMVSTASASGMQEVEDKGNGSAVLNFVGMSMPVLMTFMLGTLHVSAAWILPLLMLVSLGLMITSYLTLVAR